MVAGSRKGNRDTATKVRKQVYITPEQEILLKQIAASTGATEAEIIRQAIDRHVHVSRPHMRDLTAWTEERAYIRHLIEQGPVAGGRAWQRDDLHE